MTVTLEQVSWVKCIDCIDSREREKNKARHSRKRTTSSPLINDTTQHHILDRPSASHLAKSLCCYAALPTNLFAACSATHAVGRLPVGIGHVARAERAAFLSNGSKLGGEPRPTNGLAISVIASIGYNGTLLVEGGRFLEGFAVLESINQTLLSERHVIPVENL